ncbi:unnamed protein product, partial [Aphanomyces euteiches]
MPFKKLHVLHVDSMSLADFEVYNIVALFKAGLVAHFPTNYCNKYAPTLEIHDAVAKHPKVAAWNQAHT